MAGAASETPAHPPISERRSALLVFLLYLALSFLLFISTWRAPGRSLIFGGVDAREVTWFMGWTPYALTHGQNPFFTTYIDYPAGVNLMWNTALVFPALVMWPITALFGPVVATNAAITLALAVSGWAAYVMTRRFVQSRIAAGAAGLVYGFSPFMMSQSPGHIHMTIAVFPPLVVLALHELLIRRRHGSVLVGVALGVAAAIQLITGEEILALTAIVAVIGLLLLAVFHLKQVPAALPGLALAAGAAALTFLALAWYPLWLQFFGPLRVDGVLPDPYWTDLYAFFTPNVWQALSPFPAIAHLFTGRNTMEEGGAYVGLPLLIVALVTMIRFWPRPIVRVASLLAMVAAILAMGDHLHIAGRARRPPLPWILLQHQPLLKNVAPPRMMLFAYLAIALLLAVFVDWTITRLRGTGRLAAGALSVLALLALLPAFPYPNESFATPAFFVNGRAREIPAGSVALVAPFSLAFSSEAMMWQSQAGLSYRMPEGYAYRPGPTRDPPESALKKRLYQIYYDLERVPVDAELLARWRSDLSAMGAQTVIVGPEPQEPEMIDLFSRLLGRPPEHTQGVYVWWKVSRSDQPS